MKTIAGLFLIPVLYVPASIVLLFGVIYGLHLMPNGPGFLLTSFVFSAFSLVASVPLTFFVGIPLHYLFKFKGWTNLTHYLFLGFALGVVPFLVFESYTLIKELPVHPTPEKIRFMLTYLGLGAYCGMFAAGIFWKVDVQPNKKAGNS